MPEPAPASGQFSFRQWSPYGHPPLGGRPRAVEQDDAEQGTEAADDSLQAEPTRYLCFIAG